MNTDETSLEDRTFETQIPVQVYQRPAGSAAGSDWQELDAGPGIIHLPAGLEFSVRARNLYDETLIQLISDLNKAPEIISLNLAECRNVTNEGIRHLKALPHLTELNLSSCSLTDSGMDELKPFRHLLHLNLSYCNRITNLGLVKLRNLRNLEYLDLQGCVKINRGGLVKIQRRGLMIHK
ncbi:protein containg leucine rich repeat [Longilinea arvoryzae]|uniref:Protein containg leucine rich repeat n=1 Tax=Longilinea arvoryzae TaxID=360412 RepID=A0A0S7BIN6_9CHLR|nr:hypothetical protein [Longilinea arvoryzae]GAP15481.1 protein containg leucine rich repeat [Longilinea arvoryzae]